ncbi:centrosomal protein dilatory [Cochliomyia hominivorax]
MDLSLKGSQINLVTRQKPKPKYSSHLNLLKSSTLGHSRPRSATFFERRSYTSWSLRPQSADPKFGRNFASPCESFTTQNTDFSHLNLSKKQQKKYQSVSSSNLLKLLLDEPIKRSWLCKDSEGDTTSDLSSSRKSNSYSSLNKQDINRKYMTTLKNPLRKNSGTSNFPKESYYSYLKPTEKPDLPGRVSFSKPSTNTQHLASDDNDSSDYENLNTFMLNKTQSHDTKTEDISDISKPGPVNPLDYSFKPTTGESRSLQKELSSLSLKKSVHFGSTNNDGEEVLAETFEYPKCPSENCSCSTRSSSSGSLQESTSPKCYCNSDTCKYLREPFDNSPLKSNKMANTPETDQPPRDLEEPTESQVIRDYKNAIGEQLENSVVKNLLEENLPQKPSVAASLNNFELPSYLSKYSNSSQSLQSSEKPNNLTELHKAVNSSTNFKTEVAKKDFLKMDNKLENSSPSKKKTCSSETVINNYLKVAASSSNIIKKKDNISNPETKSNNTVTKSKTKPSLAALTQNNIKKAKSFEDSQLPAFNLDKIDTWMSRQEETKQKAALKKQTSLEESFEKFAQESLEAMSALDAEEDEDDQEEHEEEEDGKMSEKSIDHSQDDSTYEEIVSVIKEIEEDKKKDNFAERVNTDMNLKLSTTPSLETPHSAKEFEKTSESPDKFKDILSYLDNVEDSCEKTLMETRRSMPDTNRSEVEFVVEPDIAEDVPKLSDLLMLPNHQLARRVIALSLRANELANAVHLAKEHVMKVRTEKQKSIRSEKTNANNRMKEQKKHYEAIVKRHQGFIEQLLKDKGSLCEKVAALTRRLESQNQAWEHKLETEITRVKENTMAGEKIRRERWVRENTKKIKELTVKGLEAEINKMNANHLKEINELKLMHQKQLLDALEEARVKHEQIENSIRESCAQDRESIIAKERNAIRDRFEQQLAEERQTFEEQKQKLIEEQQKEKERLQSELKSKELELQTKRQEWQQEKDTELEQTITELQEKMAKQEEKFLNRLNSREKQYEADFEIWKTEYENKCKVQQVEKENAIRQHYRNERDRQIDAIVQRMDTEALKNNEEFETKFSRLKEKYEKDLQELELVEKSVREKYAETRNKLAETDAQSRNYQAEIKKLQIELEHTKKMSSEFLMERDQLRENLRSEIQNEVQALKQERDQEIQKIHKRVQQAIEKKDATIDILQKENGCLRERCLKLEAVIRQQRKDYCVK